MGELLDLSRVEYEALKKQCEYFPVGDILRLMKIAEDVHRDLKSGLDERLLLETGAVKMAELETTVRFEEILAKLSGTGGVQLPGAGNTSETGEQDFFGASGRPKSAAQSSGTTSGGTNSLSVKRPSEPQQSTFGRILNMPQLAAGWDAFIARLKSVNPMLASQVRMAELRSVQENHVKAYYAASGESSQVLVTKREHLDVITRTLRDHFNSNLSISFEVDPDKSDIDEKSSKQPQVNPQELVERSPRLKRLLERVDGEIIGIRKVDEKS